MELAYTVPAEQAGWTLKGILHDQLRLSVSQVRRLKAAGTLWVDGEVSGVRRVLRAGERVSLQLTEPAPDYPGEPGELDVLYEDGHFLAVNKPQGVIVHPTHSRYTGTLANRAWAHIRASGGDGCHIVNRLDRDTGGVTLFAKNAWACSLAAVEEKRYLAVVCGEPEENRGSILLPIRREGETGMRRIIHPEGAAAHTDYEVLGSRDGLSLLQLRLHTGRTHQIRVHCAAMGWPLLGDRLYGNEASLERSRALDVTQQALHCCLLRLRHPVSGDLLELRAKPLWKNLEFFEIAY